MAWRSREQAYQWKQKMKQYDEDGNEVTQKREKKSTTKSGKKRKSYDGVGPERMPDEFFDEEGDFNLSKVQGEKARQYFERVLGLPMPVNEVYRSVPQDTQSQEIRKAYGLTGTRMPNRR